jgi:hypothetical protein
LAGEGRRQNSRHNGAGQDRQIRSRRKPHIFKKSPQLPLHATERLSV